MNKSEFIDAIATQSGLTKAQAQAAYTAFTDTISAALERGDAVTLLGFGTFSTRRREAREGHNPKTGEKITIGASNSAAFKAGKALKERLNK